MHKWDDTKHFVIIALMPFHRKLVRFSLLNCPSIPKSKFGYVGKCKLLWWVWRAIYR